MSSVGSGSISIGRSSLMANPLTGKSPTATRLTRRGGPLSFELSGSSWPTAVDATHPSRASRAGKPVGVRDIFMLAFGWASDFLSIQPAELGDDQFPAENLVERQKTSGTGGVGDPEVSCGGADGDGFHGIVAGGA